jgi:hypothetical protein
VPRKVVRKERGIFEKEPGSGIWWIRYKIDGVERREKVGRRGDAIRLYQLRRTDAIRGVKLPPNMRHEGLRFRVIGEEAINWYIDHGRKDVRSFRWHDLRQRLHRAPKRRRTDFSGLNRQPKGRRYATANYSVRRARDGSILVARRAGSHAAATVMQATEAMAMAIAVGSSGLNW